MRISDWSSDVCSSDLNALQAWSAPRLLFANANQIYFLLPASVSIESFWRGIHVDQDIALAVSRPVQGVQGMAMGKTDVQDLLPHLSWGQVVTFDRVLLPDRKSTRLNSSH